MPLDFGSLDERITIEEPAETQNSVGETVLTWSTYATTWAKVESLSGREIERYAEVVGFTGHKVTIRYRAGVTTSMRVVYDGRTLEIGSIIERDGRWYQELICTEKLPA